MICANGHEAGMLFYQGHSIKRVYFQNNIIWERISLYVLGSTYFKLPLNRPIYNQHLDVRGPGLETPAERYAVHSGELPFGVELEENGYFSGTPVVECSVNPVIRAWLGPFFIDFSVSIIVQEFYDSV